MSRRRQRRGEILETSHAFLDAELRTGLARLEQLSHVTRSVIENSRLTMLSAEFPELVQMEGYWSEQEREVRIRISCDLTAMRATQHFLALIR